MKILNLYILIIALSIFCSCDDPNSGLPLECDKLTSREEAVDLMIQLNVNNFKDSNMIIDNLIGEWGLIGMVPGWMGFEAGQECIRLTIDSDKIELEDLNRGSVSSSEWKLKSTTVNGYTGFHLETNEDTWNNRMGMQIFSDKIMFGSGRVDDGNTYIYEKLEK